MSKKLIEKQELLNQVVDAEKFIILDEKSHRICPPEEDKCHPIIFWTKDGPNDESPSDSKIVSCLNSFLP